MCRLFAYAGKPVWLDSLLIEPEASLVSQSMAAREAKTVVNGDGCGLGWYGERDVPAWMDALPGKMRILIHSLPTRQQIVIDVQEQLIVELYSK